MPRATDDGDRRVPVVHGRPDGASHVRLASLLAERRHRAGTDGRHRIGDRLERDETVAAMLDHVVPPPFGVGLAGRGRQRTEWIDRGAIVERDLVERVVVGPGRERVGQR